MGRSRIVPDRFGAGNPKRHRALGRHLLFYRLFRWSDIYRDYDLYVIGGNGNRSSSLARVV